MIKANTILSYWVGLGISLCCAGLAQAEVRLGNRHFVLLYPQIDAVVGVYYFGIQNSGEEPALFEAPVMLPENVVDFQPQQGLAPDDITTRDDGQVWIRKMMPPGLTVASMNFKVDAWEGQTDLDFVFKQELFDFSVMTKPGGLSISSNQMKVADSPPMSQEKFDTLSLDRGEAGKTLTVAVKNIPKGRGDLWKLAGTFAGLLLVLAALASYWARPNSEQREAAAI